VAIIRGKGDNMLNELAKEVYDIAAERGWHEKEVSFGDAMINIHAEISEAWEDFRNNRPLDQMHYECTSTDRSSVSDRKCFRADLPFFENNEECAGCKFAKPCGIPSELADIIIRVLDSCHMYGIDIDQAVKEKNEYNKQRPYRHGNKKV
jgi:hypothetical protein